MNLFDLSGIQLNMKLKYLPIPCIAIQNPVFEYSSPCNTDGLIQSTSLHRTNYECNLNIWNLHKLTYETYTNSLLHWNKFLMYGIMLGYFWKAGQ